MCGGFSCSKNTLVGINVVYVMVAFLLIGVATYAKTSSHLVTLPVVGGIVACGVFLLFVSILGLIATVKHHQVMLFFYMMILFVIFVIQFSVACACIGFSEEREQDLAQKAWTAAKDNEINLIHDTEKFFGCCGYDMKDQEHLDKKEVDFCKAHIPSCSKLPDPTPTAAAPVASTVSEKNAPKDTTAGGTRRKREMTEDCLTCKSLIDNKIDKGFNAVGGLGLFFSLTEFIGIWMTARFRNQNNPRVNPRNFL